MMMMVVVVVVMEIMIAVTFLVTMKAECGIEYYCSYDYNHQNNRVMIIVVLKQIMK